MGTYDSLLKQAPPKRARQAPKRAPNRRKRAKGRSMPSGRLSDRTDARTTVRRPKRIKVRYAFEFYQDQIAKIKEIRRSAIIRGDDDFSMSDLVRKAIDAYLKTTRR